ALDRVAPGGVAPLAMADEEGGGVQRLAGVVAPFAWPRRLAQTMTVRHVEALGATVGAEMAHAGVGADLAPVLDVDGGAGPSATDVDGLRSFSADPSAAAAYGSAFADGLARGGVIAVVKHFPGLGAATGNTDYGPMATVPLSALRAGGLIPFRAAINAGVPAVMVSNATVPGLSTVPASLSGSVIGGLLRRQLGFSGLVVTDSLSAGAISDAGYTLGTAAVAAVRAGADMVLFGSTLTAAQALLLEPPEVAATTNAIVAALSDAVTSGALPADTLDAAVVQVLHAKHVDLCTGAPGG
ncbi:MAG TPA: glycoside hydrolase family 3 N-terminal domain-containing protein, partial [Acidimicrobiales bacterium]|nr:glycoside hydrolase family 3 N-terminal domain-containing protein [Acidimicrobiales bacterium]